MSFHSYLNGYEMYGWTAAMSSVFAYLVFFVGFMYCLRDLYVLKKNLKLDPLELFTHLKNYFIIIFLVFNNKDLNLLIE